MNVCSAASDSSFTLPPASGSIFGRWSSAAVVLGLAAVAVTGCDTSAGDAAGDSKRVILLTNGPDPFWDAMLAGMQDAEKDFDLQSAGLRVVREVNDGTPKGQIDRLRQYANQTDIAAVAVSMTSTRGAG